MQNHSLWPAPAKLNLMLRITGRAPNGYHLLQTVFQLLDYGDELSFELTSQSDIRLTCSIPELETDDNLITRAARALEPFRNNKKGVHIHLDKKLPMGGGVGGGSSDAATTLVALNQLWQCEQSTEQLADIGKTLGADVPVFVHGKTAWAEGIGEELTPIDIPPQHYLVVYPECFVSTPRIFGHQALTRNCETWKIRDFLAQGQPYIGENVMESVVFDLYPEVKEAYDWLIQHNPNTRMTGSGSCLFSTFDNQRELRKIAALCRWPHFIASGVSESALLSKVAN
ncbi:4-(cytidine 5'-diphospho)-2-C-methyl-D-erythritol kinase [Pleionea sp. CnH1-48]|uniref:4-(cytidine 5'-diphospho)-2-C-methyl-D-erythritol kinase n=1 Tax=Pleionea sp. CnH1-48 TaxID=2954494 RepID=UPI002097C160|nr:4-(cytidine 5'-diphospho)-2-C-methyl-D-erythritol kinase [Pleionea sp. CnH1-48]MCO7224097.1 4-(cytidine 5'-diphospho)-2-C-methyl-D-erythritol kinase [Pleionea sp. CnH1-48]